jgi:hypothetical protein
MAMLTLTHNAAKIAGLFSGWGWTDAWIAAVHQFNGKDHGLNLSPASPDDFPPRSSIRLAADPAAQLDSNPKSS